MLTDDQARARLAAHPLPANPWVVAGDDAILIKADYTDTIERLLRWVPRARWSARRRAWVVPLSGLELVRSILPELCRLAEAMNGSPVEEAHSPAGNAEDEARRCFRDHARLLFGTDWQRQTAQALGREEVALVRWVLGDAVLEAPPDVLLTEMRDLMRRRAEEISRGADALSLRLAQWPGTA